MKSPANSPSLVPSPNVAGNHQYFNAKSLSEKNAAILIEDNDLDNQIYGTVIKIISSDEKLKELSINAKAIAKPEAAKEIALSAIKQAEVI